MSCYLADYRDAERVQRLAEAIRQAVGDRSFAFMEFCGGHTHALCRHGLEDLLPAGVRMIHGPGCPVCVLPIGRLELALTLARRPGVILASYGDMMRVPARGGDSLQRARAEGADVRMVYSTAQVLDLARSNPGREVVFLAIGFETTTPPTAVMIDIAGREGLTNLSVLCNHVLTPAAVHAIMASGAAAPQLDGIVGPGHVSTVIGAEPYDAVARRYGLPIAIAGFEPVDLMEAILALVRMASAGEAGIVNGYARAVRAGGNRTAQALMARMFSVRDSFEWRGLGHIPHSALRLSDAYAAFDAEQRFGLDYVSVPDHKACQCAAILRGEKRPVDCAVFGTACTPDSPLGSCMVSAEGSCAAYYHYGRFRDHAAIREAAE